MAKEIKNIDAAVRTHLPQFAKASGGALNRVI